MKKKLAKWIGSLILISMILTSVCPLSALAADDTVPTEPTAVETTNVTGGETAQDEQPAAPLTGPATPGEATGAGQTVVNAQGNVEATLSGAGENDPQAGQGAGNTDPTTGGDPVAIVGDGTVQDSVVTPGEGAQVINGEENKPSIDEEIIGEGEKKEEAPLAGEEVKEEKKEEDKKSDEEPEKSDADEEKKDAKRSGLSKSGNEEEPTVTEMTVTNNASMFKVEAAATLKTNNLTGEASLTLTMGSNSFTKAYVGRLTEANDDGAIAIGEDLTVVLPVTGKTDGSIFVVSWYSKKSSKWSSEKVFRVNASAGTVVIENVESTMELMIDNNLTAFKVSSASLYLNNLTGEASLTLTMEDDTFTKAYVGKVAETSDAGAIVVDEDLTVVLPVAGKTDGTAFATSWFSKNTEKWYERSFTIDVTAKKLVIDEAQETEPDEPEDPGTGEQPFNNKTTVPDGTYDGTEENVEFKDPPPTKVTITIKKVIVKDGKATAVIHTSSDAQTHAYVGSNTAMPYDEAALVDKDGNLITNVYPVVDQDFEIPVAINQETTFYLRSTKMMTWTSYTYTITFSDKPLADYSSVEAAKAAIPEDLGIYTDDSVAVLQKALDAVVEGLGPEEQATIDAWAEAIAKAVKNLVVKEVPAEDDGKDVVKTYTGYVSCEQTMFPVATTCVVKKNKDGSFDAVIKMKSKDNIAQTTVYRGKAATAPNHEENWITRGWDENGVFTFTLKNIPIGEWFDLASYSVNTGQWYDRRLKISLDQNTADEQSQSEEFEVLDGGTAAVDNSTTLPDGVYTPDSFAFSGGSGRATISCRSVTVTNGRAYATIAFSSTNYGYVKAAGGVYYPSIEGGESVFTIPIQLNANNTIIGMTTAMSQAHEVTYTIYVYIEAAGAGALSGGEEIKLEHAELLKMFRYDNGCVLVEIDRTKDTVLDPEKLAKETEENKDDAAQNKTAPTEETTEAAEEEGGQSNVKTDADYAMELYQADVVKYLIVPEGVEIPAGMEKQVLVIRLPKDSVYVSSEDEAEAMESLGLLELIKATGLTEENCKNEALKNLLKDGKVVSTGEIDDVDYNKLVKAEADLVLGAGGDILPKEAEKDKKAKDYQDQYTKITERMALLNIPMLIDRSADEKDPKGQLEWLKLYGILFGKEKEADALIAKGVQ